MDQDPIISSDEHKLDTDVYNSLYQYCNYQERCGMEVIKKARDLGVSEIRIDDYLKELMDDKLLDEERFTKAYVEGKFRIKNWGRRKIKHQLKAKGVDSTLIEKCLHVISDEEYVKTALDLICDKFDRSTSKEDDQFKGKVFRYMLQKGYEHDVIYPLIFT